MSIEDLNEIQLSVLENYIENIFTCTDYEE